MINHERIAEFLIELIRFADDDDILTFLNNCSDKLTKNADKDTCDIYYYKTWLINYLFEYIYGFIEYKIPFLPPLISENGKIKRGLPIAKYPNFDVSVSNYTHIYLHLFALCECYYSYKMVFGDEKKIIKQLYKQAKKDSKIGVITDKDRTKILHLLINCYSQNKFYYYFYGNSLIKLEIVTKRISHRTEYIYKPTKYKLQDKNGVTYIINKNQNVKMALKQYLTRNTNGEVDYNTVDFEQYFMYLLDDIDFQTIKSVHQQIIKAITPCKRNVYCKCCNPNFKNTKATAICDKCRKLFFELQQFVKSIDEHEVNDYIHSIKSYDF